MKCMVWVGIAVSVWAASAPGVVPFKEDPAFKLKGNARQGQAPYVKYCLSCHGKLGDGRGPAGRQLNPKPADYTDPVRMKGMSDYYLYTIVREGAYVVGKSPLMAPWKAVLKDQEIRDVVTYIRTLQKAPKP